MGRTYRPTRRARRFRVGAIGEAEHGVGAAPEAAAQSAVNAYVASPACTRPSGRNGVVGSTGAHEPPAVA